jgi:hypothetical protein
MRDRRLLLRGLGNLAVRPGPSGRLQRVASRRRPHGRRRASHLRPVPHHQPFPPRRQGCGLWLAAGPRRHPRLHRWQRRPRPPQPDRPSHRRRHPPSRPGHARRIEGRRRRGHPPGRPCRCRRRRWHARANRRTSAGHDCSAQRPHHQSTPGHGDLQPRAAGAARRARRTDCEWPSRGAATGRLHPTPARRPALDGPHPGRGRRLWPQQRRRLPATPTPSSAEDVR